MNSDLFKSPIKIFDFNGPQNFKSFVGHLSFDLKVNEMDEEKIGFDIPKPIKEGDEIEVTIESESRRGDGVARVDGFVIFVKEGKKGETVKVKVISVGRTHAIAEKLV